MFICAITGKQSRPGDKAHRLVIEKRERFYEPVQIGERRMFREGRGWEIVREVTVSSEGLAIWAKRDEASNDAREAA